MFTSIRRRLARRRARINHSPWGAFELARLNVEQDALRRRRSKARRQMRRIVARLPW
jgi:hypothetical protein